MEGTRVPVKIHGSGLHRTKVNLHSVHPGRVYIDDAPRVFGPEIAFPERAKLSDTPNKKPGGGEVLALGQCETIPFPWA